MNPVITTNDFNTLKAVLESLRSSYTSAEIDGLGMELKKAEIVNDEMIDPDIVRLNSYIEVEDLNTNKIQKFTLVLPKLANYAEGKISVLSPIGVALIGFRQGATIEWKLPGGVKQLKILKVENLSKR